MNQITEYTGVPSPDLIANNLESVYDMVKEHLPEDTRKIVAKVLSTSSRNTRALFELKVDGDGKLRPQNVGQAMLMADMILTAGLAPSSYDNDPQKIMIGIFKAMEIGVEPISGLSNIMIVNNRPSVWGDLAQALVERSGQITKQVKEEIGEKPAPGTELQAWPDSYGWRVQTWRAGQGEPYSGEYTVSHAKRARLWMNTSKKPWISDPERMLFNRARAQSLRDGFADCLFGMGIIEEQRDFDKATNTIEVAPKGLPSPVDDDEPVTAKDIADSIADYGDETELPLGNALEDQGAKTDQPDNKED